MRKLPMDLNALQVQSFVTDELGPLPLGTVHARQREQTGPETDCTGTLECRVGGADSGNQGCGQTTLCTAVGGPCQEDEAETALCTAVGGPCRDDAQQTRGARCEASAVDACPSARGCTEIDCPA